MGDKKIDVLKKEILSHIVNDFNNQIDEVLSMCDSEIEKLMLLYFYEYFKKFKENGYWLRKYDELEFIDEEVYLQDPSLEEYIKSQNRVNKYNHRHVGNGIYHKYIGFKVRDDEYVGNWDYREFEIRPQYSLTVDEKEFRLDIAIIMNVKESLTNKIIETRKIALECDGYDYHSSPVQKRNDDMRTRKLKKAGFKDVLRYSGKELHSVKSINETHSLFREIIEILSL